MNKTVAVALCLGALAAPLATPSYAVPLATNAPITHEDELNLTQLEDRLKDTKAISPFKKLSLKGEIDGLLEQVRQAHLNGGKAEVTKLRPQYNAMIDKIYGLLGKDPQLGQDILASKQAIWNLLSDQTQFASLN